MGAQHEAEDLAGTSGRGNGSPAGEVQIYTWRDATLKELSDLVRQVVPEARNTGVRLDFSLVYTDKSGRARSRRCGSISPSASSHQSDAFVTLQSCRWQPGDFLSVCFLSLLCLQLLCDLMSQLLPSPAGCGASTSVVSGRCTLSPLMQS